MTEKKHNLIKDIFTYINIFRSFLGNKIFLVSLLSLFSVFIEAFGFLAILPVFEVLDETQPEDQSQLAKYLINFFNFIGIGDSYTYLILFIISAFLLKGIFHFGALAYTAFLTAKLLKKVKLILFDNMSSMDLLYYASKDTGYFSNIALMQTDKMILCFKSLVRAFSEIVMAMAYLSLALILSIEFGLIAIIVGLFIFLCFRSLNIYVRNLSRQSTSELGISSSYLIQFLQGFKYLLATNSMNPLETKYANSVSRYVDFDFKRRVAESLTFSLREPLLVVVIMSIILVYVVILGNSFGTIVITLAFLYRALNALHSAQIFWQLVFDGVGSLEVVEEEVKRLSLNKEKQGDKIIESLRKSIELRNLSFSYDNSNNLVLEEINMTIRSKQSHALIGHSGSGKSTLVDLISLILQPNNGKIFIDGIDATEISKGVWRSKIGFVSQDLVIFNDTISNNISMWSECNNNEVEEASKKASFHDFVSSLPNGYNTMVGDRGMKLSGGQKQRLFIARELFKKPEVLILDEATSALDSESESNIQKSVDLLMGELTIIIIAHRLSTIKNVDTVFILEEGKIIEQGDYKSLRNDKDSTLFKLIQMQDL